MPIIEVKMAAGRTSEQKRALVNGIVDAVTSACRVSESGVHVLIHEFEPDSWADGKLFLFEQDGHGTAAAPPP
jgi:4-oxalocrotonate tautomerase